MDKRRMCPNCRAFITTSDRVCPYCDMKVAPRAVDMRNPGEILGGLIPQARFTTIVILVINFALFAATWLYSQNTGLRFDQALALFGAKLPLPYMRGEPWRLITAGFLHGGVMHILMNSWVLFDLGAEVEAAYGTARMLIFYFAATVCGFALSTWWSPALSIGASAGIFGLIGAMIAYGVRERTAMGSAIKSLYIRWAVYGLVMGLLPLFSIDNAAHIGGLAAGFATAFVFPVARARTMWLQPLVRVVAAVCILLTVGAFALMFRDVIAFGASGGAR
jgi:rhomboid protease GluP